MELPFTTEQFLHVFEAYNTAIWPVQAGAYLLGLGGLAVAVWPVQGSDRIVSSILGAFWLWMGAAYHLTFFRPINPAALGFGIAFLAQGLLFLAVGVVRRRLVFAFRADVYGWTGALFVGYALAIYPALGGLLGHGYPQAPMFGVAPCPTTIFTFAVLLWTVRPVPLWLLVIPGLWSLIGVTAAVRLGILEDIGLLGAALVGTGLLFVRDHRSGAPSAPLTEPPP